MNIRRSIASLLCALSISLAGQVVHAADESPRDLFKRVVDNLPRVPFTAMMKLTNRSSVRELELNHKQLDEKTLGVYLKVLAPQDVAGTKFLIVERTDAPDEQYILIPQVARVVRLANTSKEQQLLGSEFYVSDLTLPDPNSLDLVETGRETVNGRDCKIVEVVPKPEAQWQYKKARYAVDPKDLLIIRSEFEDEKGPVKLWTLDKVEKIEGVWTPMVQRMANTRDKIESKLEITQIKYNVELPDDMFTRSRLDRDR